MKYSINDLMPYINEIEDGGIRQWTQIAIENCPYDFWTVPASSTGKHHPKIERDIGGTVIHTIRAFKVLKVLIDAEADKLTIVEQSMLLSAILLHDICRGAGKLHADEVEIYYEGKLGRKFIIQYPRIMDMISRHMGRWGTKRPETQLESLIHYADNVAAKLHLLFPEGDLYPSEVLPPYSPI
jgi:hypothetical protein